MSDLFPGDAAEHRETEEAPALHWSDAGAPRRYRYGRLQERDYPWPRGASQSPQDRKSVV